MAVCLYKKNEAGEVETNLVDPLLLKESLTDGWVLDESGEPEPEPEKTSKAKSNKKA